MAVRQKFSSKAAVKMVDGDDETSSGPIGTVSSKSSKSTRSLEVRTSLKPDAPLKSSASSEDTATPPVEDTTPLRKSSASSRKASLNDRKSNSPKKRKPRSTSMRLIKPTAEPGLQELLAGPAFQPAPVQETPNPGILTKVDGAIKNLGKLEAEIIAALFPALGASPESMESLAARLGMSLAEVQAIADSALRGLRGTRGGGSRISTVWN